MEIQGGLTTLGNITCPTVNASNWFYSSGNTGWYNTTHSGGIHMIDDEIVRIYGNKRFYVDNKSDATSGNGGEGVAAISTHGGIAASRTIWAGGNIRAGGTIVIDASTMAGDFNEGLRIVPSPSGWATIILGADNSASGAPTNGYGIFKTAANTFAIGRNNDSTGSSGFVMDASGNVTATNFFNRSDERLKFNIEEVDSTSIEKIEFKQYVKNGVKEVGVIAQQVQKYMPDAVLSNDTEDAYLSVNYNSVLSAKCALYEKKIATLEERLSKLEKLLCNG